MKLLAKFMFLLSILFAGLCHSETAKDMESEEFEFYVCSEMDVRNYKEAHWFIVQVSHRGYSPIRYSESDYGFISHIKESIENAYYKDVGCMLVDGRPFPVLSDEKLDSNGYVQKRLIASYDTNVRLDVIHIRPEFLASKLHEVEASLFESLSANLTESTFQAGYGPYVSGEQQRFKTSHMLMVAAVASMSLNKISGPLASSLGTALLVAFIGYQKGITPGRIMSELMGARQTHIGKAVLRKVVAHFRSLEHFESVRSFLTNALTIQKDSELIANSFDLDMTGLAKSAKFEFYSADVLFAEAFYLKTIRDCQKLIGSDGDQASLKGVYAHFNLIEDEMNATIAVSYSSYLYFYYQIKDMFDRFVGKNTGFILSTLLSQTVLNAACDLAAGEPFQNRVGYFSYRPDLLFIDPRNLANDVEDFCIRNWLNIAVFGWSYLRGRFALHMK
ncbi:hypothetical protein [Endozoicomonas arenosclerae]|uniref:hypothetical protein n=1 Tax=Endozoicomonas arenosclerae TaxID=1633495 RepID=UPI000783F803|nr:hypothetical protein [Endozoicomonas arenosclerae]